MAGIEDYIAQLGDENWETRRAAVEALGNLKDPQAMDPLKKVLDDPDWRVRQGAVFALGYVAGTQATPFLIKCLKADEDWHVRQGAAASLKFLKDAESVPALIDALNDPEWHVRVQAAETLGFIGDVRAMKPITDAWRTADQRGKQVMDLAMKRIRQANDPATANQPYQERRTTREDVIRMKQQAGDGCKKCSG